MRTKEQAEEDQKEALEALSGYLRDDLRVMSGEDWEVTYKVDFWDFKFLCKLGDFYRSTSSMSWLYDSRELIAKIDINASMIYYLWRKEQNEKGDDASRTQGV